MDSRGGSLAVWAIIGGMVISGISVLAQPSKKPVKTVNRLAKEKSPYLLQHANNPVDWYPWGEEAFEKAKKENKPIFLSIGYSTCHWCHVMEYESFEDRSVAKLLNDSFVSIKVDREERPDIDAVYMTVCQAMTGSGGWPMTIVMTPEKKPFFAGTYFPKENRYGKPGMMVLLPRIIETWEKDKLKVLDSADHITAAIQQTFQKSDTGARLTLGVLEEAYNHLRARFDDVHGGFSQAPKFPTPHNLTFLLRWYARTGSAQALAMVEKTLEEIRKGGIYDQVGFGIHRYSTDEHWLLPHFEKMLYDQAQIAMAAAETFQATKRPLYEKMTREILTYVLRDLRDKRGGFYSAEDADSERVEGKFYVWTRNEMIKVLGKQDGEWCANVFQMKQEGNFQPEAPGTPPLSNILHLKDVEVLLDGKQAARLEKIRRKLLDVRSKRVRPLLDDKVLTDWNGLMIAAFAKASMALNDPVYAKVASQAADFILKTLRQKDGRLLHRYRDGEAAIMGTLEDYAFFTWGLIELYEATFEPRYLGEAKALTEIMMNLFWDGGGEGFFLTGKDHEVLLARPKEVYDGALPSGNSVAAMNLHRLARLTGDEEWARNAEGVERAFGAGVVRAPSAYTQFLQAVDFSEGPVREVVIVGPRQHAFTKKMIEAVRGRFAPRQVTVWHPGKDPVLFGLAPWVANQVMLYGLPTAYVCEHFACKLPTNDPGQLVKMLEEK